MHRAAFVPFLLAMFALGSTGAAADDGLDVETAAQRLSLYAPGHMPSEAPVLHALTALRERGTRSDVSLLRHIARSESVTIANAALDGISAIRDRQLAHQRQSFQAELTRSPSIGQEERRLRAAGIGPEQAHCQAYAVAVLGPDSSDVRRTGLASAEPLVRARALEESGRVRQALRVYSEQAATGDSSARAALQAFGVQTERLLLGMLVLTEDDTIIDVLVRQGGPLTVRVLVERAHRSDPAQRASAAEALRRMLTRDERPVPLNEASMQAAHRALHKVMAE